MVSHKFLEQREVERRDPRPASCGRCTSTPRVEPMRHGVHLPHDSMRAELHRVARHLRHVDRVVEDDDAAVADQRLMLVNAS